MKHYLLLGLSLGAILLGGCGEQPGIVVNGENNKTQEIVYQSQVLASPIFNLTGTVFSGTQSIIISRENSGTKKEYTLSYSPTQTDFSEEFRLDKGNIAYGTNNYIFIFSDKKNNIIGKGKLQLTTHYQNISLSGITLYFDEKGVNNCGTGCWTHRFREDTEKTLPKDKNVEGKNGIDETINFALGEVVPYENTPILYKNGEKFIVTIGSVFYNQKLGQFFEAKNIYNISGDERLILGDLYMNGNLIIKEFPVGYRNTGGGRKISIIYQPNKDLISATWQDGDGCGYTKGEAKYKLSNRQVIIYDEINSSDGITLQIDNKKFKINKILSGEELSLISNNGGKQEVLVNNQKINYNNTSSDSPCQTDVTREINQKTHEIIVKKMPIVGGKLQTFIRTFDNSGNIVKMN